MRKIANAQELEAWDEKYPYFPPQIPYTRCTCDLSSGSWQGRTLCTEFLTSVLETWSLTVIIPATKSRMRYVFFPNLLMINANISAYNGIQINRLLAQYITKSSTELFIPFRNRNKSLSADFNISNTRKCKRRSH